MVDGTSLQASEGETLWIKILTVGLVAAVYFGTGVVDHEVWSPTEPAVAGVVWNIVRHGSFAVPRIDEFPYLEKPPLAYWLSWLSCQVTGELSAACLRFPSTVVGVLSLCLFYWILRRRNGAPVACLTVLFAAMSIEFYQFSHRAGAHILTVFFAGLCFTFFSTTLLRAGSSEAKILACDLGFAGALAVSFYAKNFFTHLFVLPPVIMFLLYKREFHRAFRSMALVTLLTALVVLPWALALQREGGWEYLRVVFFDNTFGRFFNFADPGKFSPGPLNDAFAVERGSSAFLYLGTLLWVPAPWSLIFLASMIWLFRQRDCDDLRLFQKLAIVVVPVVLTFSASRTSDYLVPLLFVMLLMVADLLHDLLSDAQHVTRLERALCLTNIVVVVSGLVIAQIVLGVYFSQPVFFGLSPLIALTFVCFAWRLRSEWFGWRFIYGSACLTMLGMLVTMVVFLPALDAKNSYSPFFDQVRDQSRDRELYTTLLDDKRLPLTEFYLDRRVPIIRDDEKLFQLLNSGAKVSVILRRRSYEQLKKRFDLIPHQLITPSSGNQFLVLVNSP